MAPVEAERRCLSLSALARWGQDGNLPRSLLGRGGNPAPTGNVQRSEGGGKRGSTIWRLLLMTGDDALVSSCGSDGALG